MIKMSLLHRLLVIVALNAVLLQLVFIVGANARSWIGHRIRNRIFHSDRHGGYEEDSTTFDDRKLSTKEYREQVDYLVNLIEKAERDGISYQHQTDAAAHSPQSVDHIVKGHFEFIIVGAGSSGSVIANRLSEKFKVLLLDAGDFGDNLTDIPNMYFPVEFTKYNWGFTSIPQKTSCLGMVDQKCPMDRGKGIGGTTLINGLVYSRGSSIDFDKWAEHVDDPRWSYDSVLEFFKKSENFHHRDKEAPVVERAHGYDGELHVEYHLPKSPHLTAFLRANLELKFPVADYNAGTGLGASPSQVNTKFGKRFDGGKAFIRPILNRKNLEIIPNSYVTKVLIHDGNKTAYGVAFTHGGQNYIAHAHKEVILSAGAISTPQILMLSGIGPKHHLISLGIPVIKDLEVGSALKDHPCFYGLNFGTNYYEPIRPLKAYVEEYLKGYGPLAAPGNNQGVAFYESQFTKGTGYPDIEIMLVPANASTGLSEKSFRLTRETYEDVWGNSSRTNTFIMYIVALHAESTGSIRLKSKNPFDYPLIDTNFLSDRHNKDIKTIYEGIQLGLKLANTASLKKIGTRLQGGPLRACKQFMYLSEEYWYCAIRQMTMNLYHPIGSCPMGPNPKKGDVVDSQMRVHGVKNLRVADTSVFPFNLAGHPNAPAVLVGEMLADILKTDYCSMKLFKKIYC